MSLSDLCSTYVNTARLKDETERNIIEFAEAPWGLGMGYHPDIPPLFPVQKFIFKCTYNIPLDDKESKIIVRDRFNERDRFRFTEVEYFQFLQDEGRINIKEVTGDPKDMRNTLVLVIGRRGCKTSSIAVMVSYETYKLLKKNCPQQYYKIMPDDEIRISCIATNQEQASELFRRITGHIEQSDYFKKYRNKPTLSYMQLSSQRDIDKYGVAGRPSLRIVASPCSGRGLRGHNNIICIMDEMAYFFENDQSVDRSDTAIYDAVTPSTAKFNSPEGNPDGRTICISSPNCKTGKFFDLYQRSFDPECKDILMIKAPSWEVDYTLSSKFLRAKFSENPVTYDVEYGAEFSDRVSAWLENEQVLRMNIIPGLKLKERSYERTAHFMGIDVGLKNDGSAIAIGHVIKKDTPNGPKDYIELDCVDVRYADEEGKDYFRPEEIAAWIASYMDKFFIVKGIMDQYYGMAIKPVLDEKGMKQIETVSVSRDFNSTLYQNLMAKFLDGSVRIPEGSGQGKDKDISLVKELLTLQATHHSKHIISVEAPESRGLHDDMSDAFARMVYLATEYLTSGGGVAKHNVSMTSGASSSSYMKHYQKQKRVAMYTNRPSASMIAEMSRGRHFGLSSRSLGRFGR